MRKRLNSRRSTIEIPDMKPLSESHIFGIRLGSIFNRIEKQRAVAIPMLMNSLKVGLAIPGLPTITRGGNKSLTSVLPILGFFEDD